MCLITPGLIHKGSLMKATVTIGEKEIKQLIATEFGVKIEDVVFSFSQEYDFRGDPMGSKVKASVSVEYNPPVKI